MNILNFAALSSSIFFAYSANCASLFKMSTTLPAMLPMPKVTLLNMPTTPPLYTFTRPMACSETSNKATFVAALKDSNNNRAKLAAILNCSSAMGLIAKLDESDLKVGNALPTVLREALQNKLDEIQYGYLQLDNDRTLQSCIGKINEISTISADKICPSFSLTCNKEDITTWGKTLTSTTPCSHPFMKKRVEGMVAAIIASIGTETTVQRAKILADVKAITDTAPVTIVKAAILTNKVMEGTPYDARKNLEQILHVTPVETQES